MGRRSGYHMVKEDDPQWLRFWTAYPRAVAKKEARKAWAQLNPSPQIVDHMIEALEWQVPMNRWDSEKRDYAPYPASWLNGERWTDVPPRHVSKPQLGASAMTVIKTLLGPSDVEVV